MATHFLQQRLLVSQVELARRIHLPIVVREKAASEKVIEVITQASSTPPADSQTDWQLPVAIHAFSGSDAQLSAYIAAGFYVMINGQICDLRMDNGSKADSRGDSDNAPPLLLPELAGEGATLFRQLRAGLLPIERLLLSSDAPLHTPQNIDDIHTRSQRNEPANLPFVHEIVATAYRMPAERLMRQLEHNARTFYQLRHKSADTADDSKQSAPQANTDAQQQQNATNGEKGRNAVSNAEQSAGQSDSSGNGSGKKQVIAMVRKMKQHSITDLATAGSTQHQTTAAEDSSADGLSEEPSEDEDEEGDGQQDDEAESNSSAQRNQRRQEEENVDGSEDEDEDEGEELEGSKDASQGGDLMQAAGRRNRSNKQAGDARGGHSEEDDWSVSYKSRRKAAAAGTTAVRGKAQGRQDRPLKEISNTGQGESEEKEQESDDEQNDTSSAPRQQKQPTARRHKVAAAAVSSSASSSRHRLVGGEVDLSLERDILRYACRRCRTVLFSEDDVIPHANPTDTASSLSATSSSSSAASGGGGRKKGQLSSADLTHCESSFIRPMTWMRNIHTSGGTSSHKPSAVLVNSDRIECPCGAKLGRCGMVALYIPCSCGRLCDGPPPYFAVHRSKVDVIDRSALQALAAPRAVGEQWTEAQRDAEEQERLRQTSKKERDRQKKDNKRVKRQTRNDQKGNFSEFRNKSLVHAKNRTAAEEGDITNNHTHTEADT